MKIWDCFLFNGEEECLNIRINELSKLPVQHIAVHSGKTFTGKEKIRYWPYSVAGNFFDVYVADMPEKGTAWDREAHQRNAIMRGLKDANDEDIVIISDIDEIPRAEAIKQYRPEMGLTALKMDVFWYKLNCLAEKQTWVHPRIMTYKYLKSKSPQEVRGSGYDSLIENAGHHFSYLGDEKFIANKLRSFSHQEYNTPEYTNEGYIKKCIESGKSIWGEGQFKFVPLDETFPKYILENQKRLAHLIHKI